MHKLNYLVEKAIFNHTHAEFLLKENKNNKYKLVTEKNDTTQGNENHDTQNRKPRVLLVEDDPIVQFVHKRYLELLKCNVFIAENGYQALELFKTKPDLIFMDIGLPKMSGIDVCRAIRKQENGHHVPIIVVTAFEDSIASQCKEAGTDDLATKPILESELAMILHRWLLNYFPRCKEDDKSS